MPLFAAYAQTSKAEEVDGPGRDASWDEVLQDSRETLDWLANPSFCAKNLEENTNYVVTEEDQEVGVESSTETGSQSRRDGKSDGAQVNTEKKHRKKVKRKRSRSPSRSPKTKKKKKKKDRKKDDRLETKPSSSREPLPLLNLPRSIVFSNNLGLRLEQSFYIDREKDRNNLAFNCMYAKHVARYTSAQGVMGINLPRQTERRKKKVFRYFRKSFAKRIGQAAGINSEEESIRARVAEFNEKLREDPRNVKLWLDFLNYQDRAIRLQAPETAEGDSKLKATGQRSILERKIAIIDRAIESNPKSVELIVTKLTLAEEFWEFPALHQEWKKSLFVHPTSVTLWKSYLSYVEHYYEGFSVGNVLKAYSTCIQKFVQMQKPSFASHQRPARLEEHLIDIFVRLGNFLRRSGLTEKSTALFQAAMELNLNRPREFDSVTNDMKDLISLLEPFWDCGAPRFGEDDARGWATVLRTKEKNLRQIHGRDLSHEEDEIVSSGKPRSEVWLQIESLRSRYHWQPWSAEPEVDEECDDPDRTVSVEDLSPFLFTLKQDEAVKFRLIVGFLSSLGVPLLPGSQTQRTWAPAAEVDGYFQFSLKIPDSFQLIRTEPSVLEHEQYYNFTGQVFQQSFDKLVDPYKSELATWWLQFQERRVATLKRNLSSQEFRERWVSIKKESKSLLRKIPGDNSRMNFLLYAAYARLEHAAGSTEEAVKILEKILSMTGENPLVNPGQHNSALLRLWRTFMELCLECKQFEKARALLMNLGSKLPFDSKFRSTAALQLKSKRNFEHLKDELDFPMEQIIQGIGLFSQVDFVVDYLVTYAYCVALTEGLNASCSVMTDWLAATRQDVELNEQQKFDALVLQYHLRRETIQMALQQLINRSRDFTNELQLDLHSRTLREAVTSYPGNCEILLSFIQSEERCSIVSRLWTTMENMAKTSSEESLTVAYANCLALALRQDSVKQAELDTWREVSRTEGIAVYHRAFQNKLRNVAESCVSRPPGRYCPALWRICLRAAFLTGNLNKCKALFYRAVRECPSSKALYMDIVKYVPSMVKEVTQILAEKELRLRFPLEELDVLLEPEPEDMEDLVVAEDPTRQAQQSETESEDDTDGEGSSEFIDSDI